MSEITPTSVILFDAATAYANGTADTSIRSDLRIAFVAGAEWQWKRVGDDLATKDAEIERLRRELKVFVDFQEEIMEVIPSSLKRTMEYAFATSRSALNLEPANV